MCWILFRQMPPKYQHLLFAGFPRCHFARLDNNLEIAVVSNLH
jgi:hypothetical protein